MIAGPNGSGKSTLTDQLRESGLDLGRYINADEIDRALPGPAGEKRSKEAQALADQARRQCLAAGETFSFETVMSHPSKIDFLKEAREQGYAVAVFFVALETPELNLERVRQRVALGGHAVPENRIGPRYTRSLELLPQAIAQCDRAVLFDNSYRVEPGGRIKLIPICEIRRIEISGQWERLQGFTPAGARLTRAHISGLPIWSRAVLSGLLGGYVHRSHYSRITVRRRGDAPEG
jgi:predicted ABC-type ATPase